MGLKIKNRNNMNTKKFVKYAYFSLSAEKRRNKAILIQNQK